MWKACDYALSVRAALAVSHVAVPAGDRPQCTLECLPYLQTVVKNALFWPTIRDDDIKVGAGPRPYHRAHLKMGEKSCS